MKFIVRHPIFSLLIVISLVLSSYTIKIYIDRQDQENSNQWGDESTLVATAPVIITTMIDRIESIGTAKANESVFLISKVNETVTNVNFEDGMHVEAGTILVELTNSEETAQLAEAQANVDEATRQYKRLENLIQQKLASETQLDVEKARMQTATARLEAILARLDDRLIRAPFSGVLGFREISPGTLLSPNTVVTTLDDIRIIKLDFSVPESYLSVLEPGQEVIAKSSAYPERSFTGTVQTINSRVDSVTRSISIRALLDNSEKLIKPGMLLSVNLVQERTLALVVPEEAIIPIQSQQFVYVVEDGFAQRIEIQAGRRRLGVVEVISGLREGQQVITQGAIKIRPGSAVTIK